MEKKGDSSRAALLARLTVWYFRQQRSNAMQLHRTTTTTKSRRTAQSVGRSLLLFPIKLADASFPSVRQECGLCAHTRCRCRCDDDAAAAAPCCFVPGNSRSSLHHYLQPRIAVEQQRQRVEPDESGRQLHYTLIYTTERRDRHVYYFLQGRISPERHQKK